VPEQAAVRRDVPPAILAEAMPRHFSDFVRNGPMDKIRPLGTTPAPQRAQQRYAAPQTFTSGTSTAVYYPPQQPQQPGGEWQA
jgi:hypothetical protein